VHCALRTQPKIDLNKLNIIAKAILFRFFKQKSSGSERLSITIWTKASPRLKRILSTIFILIIAIVVTVIGTFTPIDPQDATQISNDLNQTTTTLGEQGALSSFIFGNNLTICLIMFIPVIGPLLGLYIMYSTGTVVGAIAVAGGYPPILALVALFITPVAWIEFAAYATAMTESIWLFRRLLQGFRLGLHELRKNTTLFITICTLLLAVGAVVETALISIGA
jgi:uncharacterized membrane protein SpoIIM required for sporulation